MQESEPEAPAAPAAAEEPAKALPTHFAVESGEGAPVQAPESLSPTTSLAEMIAFARKFKRDRHLPLSGPPGGYASVRQHCP
jgi:hypothetical protein